MLGAIGLPGTSGFVGEMLVLLGVFQKNFLVAILASIVLSWLAPQTKHPGAYLLHQLTEPVMSPVRRMLPNLGGLDFSPILVFIMINLVDMLVIQNAASTFGMPRGLVLGL